MKNILFGLITTVLFNVPSYGQQDLKSKLIALEKTLASLNQNESDYKLNDVENSNNNYDDYGVKIYTVYNNIRDYINGFESKPDYDNKIKPFVEKQINSIIPYNNNLTGESKLIYENYMINIKYKNSIEISKAYENFVYENFKDQSKFENLLKTISIIKYSTFAARGRTFSVREICANDCMSDMFNNFNPIQWAQFAAGFLAGSLYWSYASCWYDCW